MGTVTLRLRVPIGVLAIIAVFYCGFEQYSAAAANCSFPDDLSNIATFSATYLSENTSAGSRAMITSPDGALLLALNQARENDGYQVGTMGALTGPTVVQLPSGFTPFNPAIGGQGRYLYVSNLLGLETTEAAEYTVGSNRADGGGHSSFIESATDGG